MSSCRSTRGIILKISSHGESDKIVTWYSPDIGRVVSIAKGAKRSRRRFVNKLEEFTLLNITYRPARNNGLLFLSEASLENAFLGLRRDHRRYLAAMLACELVLRFTSEQDSDPAIFNLLFWLFTSLDQGSPPLQNTALFHLRLLGAAGYQPSLQGCCSCGHRVNSGRAFALQPANGSLVCNRCNAHVQRSKFSLSLQTIRFLQSAQQLDLARLERLQMPDRSARECLQVLYRYSQHLLQRDIHSWRFVRTLL